MKKILFILSIFVSFVINAQDKKISQLPALPSVSGNEQLPLAYSGSNYYMTPSQLRTWLNIVGYAPLAGTLSSAPMTGGLEWRGNKIALYDTSGLMILFAGNKKISPTIYSAINFSNSDSLRIKSTDASGNSSLHSLIGSIQTFVTQSTSFTNTTTYSPTNTTFTKPCNYASNLSSLFTKYTHIDSLWGSTHYAPISGGSYVPLSGTTNGNPLTNTIEFDNSISNSTTALWQNSATGQGLYLGIGNNRNLAIATNQTSINFTDGYAEFGSTDNIHYYNQIDLDKDHGIFFKTTNNDSSFATELDISSTGQVALFSNYHKFKGFQYDAGTCNKINLYYDSTTLSHSGLNKRLFVPQSRTLTINGITYDLSANRTWTVTSGTTYTNTAPITITSGTVIGISQSNTSTNGYLSSTDWNTFNNKQPQLNGTGFVKASGTTISYDNSTYLTTSSAASTYAPINNPTFTGNVTLAQDATSNLQAVTLQQLNNAILGTDYKQACKYVTVSTLPAYTYNNGSSGVGATITGVSFGAITFDGVTPSVGDRVLVALETGGNAPYNGIYTVTTVGAVATLYVLTRATDYNQSSEITSGDAVFISAGNTKAASTYVYNGITAPTIGTTNITFVQTQGQGVYSAGAGLTLSSNTFAVGTSAITNSMLAGSISNSNLSNSTISGVSLGSNLFNLSNGYGILGGTYNGSSAITLKVDSTHLVDKLFLTAQLGGKANTNATFTVNGTNISLGSSATITSAAGTLTGTGLNSSVVTSSLTTVATVTTGTWNSKIIPVVGTVTTASVITINTDNYNYYTVTSLSVATTFTVPTGTPSAGQPLTIRIKDNGTARALTFSTGSNGFRFSSNLPAPTTTTLSKTLYATFRWNEADSFWDCQGYMDGY